MMDTEASEMPWWFTRDEEMLHGSRLTREAAIEAGTIDFEGEPFLICQGGHFRNQCDIFDIELIADLFDDANEDYAGEENPSVQWTEAHEAELVDELNAAVGAWARRHGYDKAYAIDCGPYETIAPAARAAS